MLIVNAAFLAVIRIKTKQATSEELRTVCLVDSCLPFLLHITLMTAMILWSILN